MNIGDFPRDTRLKLPEELESELWSRVDELGPEEFSTGDYSRSDIYNWKSRDLFLPAGFVHDVLGDVKGKVTVKGGGNGSKVEVELPVEFPGELCTRMGYVNVNSDGVPVYRPSDSSLVDRFLELLESYSVDYTVYRRSGREVRFPSVFYRIIRAGGSETDFGAVVDEEGKIEDGMLKAGDREVPVEEFEGRLYSREKRMELAVETGDSGEIESLIREETGKIRELFS